MTKYIIKDWAGNIIKLNGVAQTFRTFEDAENALALALGDSYEQDRCEYQITEIEN